MIWVGDLTIASSFRVPRNEGDDDRPSMGVRLIRPRSDGAAIEASRVDPLAFASVFDRHWPKLYRYCAFRAGTAGEDIAAETFRVAFDQRARYDGREDAGPWLFGIATNLLRELFRRSARADRALSRVIGDVEFDSVDGVIDRLDAQLARPELASVVARMSPVERDALLLHACAELTFEEIARATSVPVGTVSSRIRRAKVQMRAHFESLEVYR